MTLSRQLFANNAKTTIAAAVSPTDTTIQLTDGSRFPIPAAGEFFLVTIEAGTSIEVVLVTGRTGNALTGCQREYEGTAANFPVGAKAEARTTAATLASFARKVDRMDEVSSVDALDSPANSNSNSYICHSNDDAGFPIIAYKNTGTSWYFNTHKHVQASGSATSGTNTTITSTGIGNNIAFPVAGKYIIQFFTGNNIGLARLVTASGVNTATWATSLPNPVSAGDQFQVYKSDNSVINDLLSSADDGLIYAILLGD